MIRPAFTSQCVWAAAALGKQHGGFGFKQIEKDVGLDRWWPYHKMASNPFFALLECDALLEIASRK